MCKLHQVRLQFQTIERSAGEMRNGLPLIRPVSTNDPDPNAYDIGVGVNANLDMMIRNALNVSNGILGEVTVGYGPTSGLLLRQVPSNETIQKMYIFPGSQTALNSPLLRDMFRTDFNDWVAYHQEKARKSLSARRSKQRRQCAIDEVQMYKNIVEDILYVLCLPVLFGQIENIREISRNGREFLPKFLVGKAFRF